MRVFFIFSPIGLYVQRVGDRNNDCAVSDAGRTAFLNLFYGFNHPIYREIEYRDLRNKVLYPNQVKQQRKKNLTYSKSAEKSRNQGGDFLLEQKIQRQKMIAPKGIISSTTWQRISRSIDKIDGILENSSKILGTVEETRNRTIILNKETIEWRAILRHSNFLENEPQEHVVNIYGEEI